MSNNPKSILLVKTSSLGDVVHTLPAVTDAARHGAKIDWVVEENFADIPRTHPDVNQVIPIAIRRWRKNVGKHRQEIKSFVAKLREQKYDLVIDSQGLIKSALVAYLSRGKKLGFSHTTAREPWSAFFYNQHVNVPWGQHAIDRQRQLFAQALGYEISEELPEVFPAGQRNKQVWLFHATTWETKHWPESMWGALAQFVIKEGFEPCVTWGSDEEQARAQRLANKWNVTVIAQRSLADLSLLIRSAAGCIGVDSGLTHLSAALGTPTVALFGPTNADLTGVKGLRADTLVGNVHCSPCLQSHCKHFNGEPVQFNGEVVQPACMAQLNPQAVWQACQQQTALA